MPLPAYARLLVLYGMPLAAVGLCLLLPPPAGLSPQAWSVAVVAALMAVWWMTEIVPLAVTALVPLIAFPLFGVRTIDETAVSYAHPLIFLFLGGFLLAQAMERWGLHRRLALHVVGLGGREPSRIIASLMAVTAFLSLWISNTATAMVMLPIGRSLVASHEENEAASQNGQNAFGTALMLGIGYAATIGGIGSLIGTPPNALFASFMKDTYGIEIGFAQWMLIGLPVVLVLLPITWWLLTGVLFRISPENGQVETSALADHGGKPEPMTRGESRVAAVMVAVALLWILRPVLERLVPGLGLSDPGIAVLGAVLLFVIPADLSRGEFLLRWQDAAKIRWDILILFGGGLALAAGIGSSGLAGWIGETSTGFAHLPQLVLIAAISVVIVYLGELASNTAVAAVFLPVAGAVAVGAGVAPLSLTLPITLAASLGFMLPVATPPNAIVFGSGAVTAQQMLRAGAILDVIGIVVVVLIGTLLGPVVFPSG